MIHLSRVVLAFLLFLGLGQTAFAEVCDGLFDDVVVDTVLNYGDVSYERVPHSRIVKLDKLHNPDKTRGVTVAETRIGYEFELEKKKVDGGFCVAVRKIKFFAGYPMLTVFVDDKYDVGSCEYEAIKEHELGHVDIYQKELKYYGDLILLDLREFGENLKPMFFKNNVEDKFVRKKLDTMIGNSPVMAVMEKLDDRLKKQNMEYDTVDEYKRVQAECSGW